MGKSRVAPLKQTTIPRMELTAAVVAVDMDKLLKRELQMNLLDDSTTVLMYIENETLRLKTFVANHIATISETTTPQQWRYVSTSVNPTDCASRGLMPIKFMINQSWFHGPAFLKGPECQWPDRPDEVKIEGEDSEVRHAAKVRLTQAAEVTNPVNKLINHNSNWFQLKRAVAWFLWLKDLLLQCSKKQKTHSQADFNGERKMVHQTKHYDKSAATRSVTVEDLMKVEMEIIKFIQGQQFQEEILMLQKGSNVKRSSHLSKLDPRIQGVISVGSRIGASAMPEHAKHPVIIPKNSHVTILILQDFHEKIGHCGRSYMLSQLRQRYWIPSANSMVRFLSRCVTCRKVKGKAQEQKMADLPEDRLLPDNRPLQMAAWTILGQLTLSKVVTQSKDMAYCLPALQPEQCT